MIESRTKIEDIEKVKSKLLDLGADYRGYYAFNDVIFVSKKNRSFDNGFLRLRDYKVNNWPTKKVILSRKEAKFEDIRRISEPNLRKEFDVEKAALDYIDKEFNFDFVRDFEYEREGWQYDLGKVRIFVENIKGYGASIEIEAESQNQIRCLYDQIEAGEVTNRSMPEIMKEIIKPAS